MDQRATTSDGPEPPPDGDEPAPLDPRILALAGIIGRLIAREQFRALTQGETAADPKASRPS